MSPSPEFSDTAKVLAAFSEALRFWALHLSAKDGDLQKAVPPAALANPLAELDKTAKLIKAHTTKVGIVFEPSKIAPAPTKTTLSDLSKSFIVFMSALSSVSPVDVSSIYYHEICSVGATLVNAAVVFTDELHDLLEKTGQPAETPEKDSTTESNPANSEVDARLVSVGKIWNTCDDLVKLISEGKLKFLEKKTRMHLSLIEDGLDEFADWTEDPGNFDDEDPFGLDEFSDEEPPTPADSADSDDDNVHEAVVSFAKTWLQKFKLVKLLFLSINKSLGSLVSGEKIDQIFALEAAICRSVDELIVELMVNQVLDDEVTGISKAIDKSCSSIIKLLRDANKASDNKVKWCTSWESKYSELSQEMYN